MQDTKHCYKCKETKSSVEFYQYVVSKTGKTRLMSSCKSCSKGVSSPRKRQLRWYHEYREGLNCYDCGLSFLGQPYLCDFHHVDPSQKVMTISQAVWTVKPVEMLQQELAKCIPLCANCHRIRHYKKAPRLS